MPERKLDAHLSQWIVQALCRWLATFAIVQGAAIIVGGEERWRGPSFVTALTIPGAPESWGFVLLVLGVVALWGTFTPHLRATAYALFGIGAWAFFFTATFVVTLLTIPDAATTGIITYAHLGVAACVLAVAYRRSRP